MQVKSGNALRKGECQFASNGRLPQLVRYLPQSLQMHARSHVGRTVQLKLTGQVAIQARLLYHTVWLTRLRMHRQQLVWNKT